MGKSALENQTFFYMVLVNTFERIKMRDSKMEIKIYEILKDAGLPFEEEYEFSGLVGKSGMPLRFDFCIFDDDGNIDFLIEAQGRQHYVPVSKFGGSRALKYQKYNDMLKRKYCLKHNLKLVTIPYYDEGKITYSYIMQAAGYY